jgi:hypothetical protein
MFTFGRGDPPEIGDSLKISEPPDWELQHRPRGVLLSQNGNDFNTRYELLSSYPILYTFIKSSFLKQSVNFDITTTEHLGTTPPPPMSPAEAEMQRLDGRRCASNGRSDTTIL